MAKAIVTLVIGDKHHNLWRKLALPSWQRYAARHGYEIIAIERPLDESEFAKRRNVTWQKLLVLDHSEVRRFERVLWLDSDIVINDLTAPCPVDQTPPELVGAVADQALLSHPALAGPFSRINHWPGTSEELARAGYQINGLAPAGDFYLNSGTLVLSRDHRTLLQEVYAASEDGGRLYDEQFFLSAILLRRRLFHPLDPRFNQLWLDYKHASYAMLRIAPSMLSLCIATALSNCFFLHFAGRHRDMERFDPAVTISGERFSLPPQYMRTIAEEWAGLAAVVERERQNATIEGTPL